MNKRKYYSLVPGQKDILIPKIFLGKKCQDMLCISVYFSITNANIEAMKKAYNILLKENDALRLTLVFKNGFKQFIKDYEERDIKTIELESKDNLMEIMPKYRKIFDPIVNAPLTNAYIFSYPTGATILMNFHHFVFDGYSIGLVFEKYRKYYEAIINGEEIDFKEKYSFEDFIKEKEEYYNSPVYKQDLKYWKNKIYNMKYLRIFYPIFRPNSLVKNKRFTIQNDLYIKIKQYCEQIKVPIYYFVGSIYALTTCKENNKPGMSILNFTHGRYKYAQKNLIGCAFLDTLSFFHIDNSKSIKDYICSSYLDYLENIKRGNIDSLKMVLLTLRKFLQIGRINYYCFILSQLDLDEKTNDNDYAYGFLQYKHQPNQVYCVVNDKKTELDVNLTYQERIIKDDKVDETISKTLINIENIVNGEYINVCDVE